MNRAELRRLSRTAKWTVACLTVATLCLLWSVVVLADVLISHSP